jgi:hypothetical protein
MGTKAILEVKAACVKHAYLISTYKSWWLRKNKAFNTIFPYVPRSITFLYKNLHPFFFTLSAMSSTINFKKKGFTNGALGLVGSALAEEQIFKIPSLD